jgi:hypothetical protein
MIKTNKIIFGKPEEKVQLGELGTDGRILLNLF